MTDAKEQELTEEEKEEQAYLDAFKEEGKALSAEPESDEASVAKDDDDSPDDKDPDTDDSDDESSEKGTASDETKDEAPDPYAWIDDLTPEAQKQAKALKSAVMSSSGRVSSLQRRLNDADAREHARANTQAKGRAATAPPKSPETKEDKELSPKLKEFVDTYPELASSVQEMVKNDRTELEAMIDARLQPINEEAAFQRESEARQRLEQGASEIFDTPTSSVHYTDVLNSDLYNKTFLESQPAEFRQMATTTADPDTALWVLQTFATWAEQYAKDNDLLKEDTAPKSKADKASARRTSNKAAAGTPASRSAVTDPEDVADYEAMFKREALKAR